MSVFRWLSVSLLALGAIPCAAQTSAPDDTGDEIVVTGRADQPDRKEVFDQALDLSRVDPGNMYEESLARFTAPVCPQVSGLREELAGEIVARLKANAQRLDLRVGNSRCRPNLLVMFLDDGQSLIADLSEGHPDLFGLVDKAEQQELLAGDAPVRVWNVVETKWANGAPLQYRKGKPVMPSVRGRSNQMFLPTRKDIDFALVAFERDAVVGMTATQLADYATMRGLSHTRPASGTEPMETILALFEGDADYAPPELTNFDIGYLESVYFWRADRSVPAVGRLLSVRRRAEAAENSTDP